MRRILAAALMLVAASFATQAQTCLFTAAQVPGSLREFTLTPPVGGLNNFGASAPAAPYGVYWKPALGTETRMEVVSWAAGAIRARVPADVRVCPGAYSIVLRLPRNLTLGRLADCEFMFLVRLTETSAPNGNDPNCSVLPVPTPTPDCGALQTAAANFFNLRVAGGTASGQPVTAELVNTSGTPLQTGVSLTLPGVLGGVTVSGVQWSISDDPGRETLTPRADYVADAGANSRRTSFTLAPRVVEALRGVTPPPVRRFVRATLTLTVALPTGTTRCAVSISAPFDHAALPVPRVLVLFRRAGFDAPDGGIGRDAGAPLRRGVLVVMSPGAVDGAGRPIAGLGRLIVELNRLGSVLPSGSFAASSPLASAAAFALGLQELRDELSEVTRDTSYSQSFQLAREISSLRDVRMVPGGTLAEDMFNSLMYVGPAGSGAEFFNNQKLVADQGAFELRLSQGSFFASVRDLRFTNDAAAARFVRGGTVRVTTPPGGPKYALIGNEIWGDNLCCHQAKDFGAELSSLRFIP